MHAQCFYFRIVTNFINFVYNSSQAQVARMVTKYVRRLHRKKKHILLKNSFRNKNSNGLSKTEEAKQLKILWWNTQKVYCVILFLFKSLIYYGLVSQFLEMVLDNTLNVVWTAWYKLYATAFRSVLVSTATSHRAPHSVLGCPCTRLLFLRIFSFFFICLKISAGIPDFRVDLQISSLLVLTWSWWRGSGLDWCVCLKPRDLLPIQFRENFGKNPKLWICAKDMVFGRNLPNINVRWPIKGSKNADFSLFF